MIRFAAILVFGVCTFSYGAVIDPSKRVDWTAGITVGPLVNSFPTRTNIINVTQSPYNADNTGSSDAASAINSAISAAANGDVVYFPTGVYKLAGSSGITITRSYITIRGDGPSNTIIRALTSNPSAIALGNTTLTADANRKFFISAGGTKGSTNITVSPTTSGFGEPLYAGSLYEISIPTLNTGTTNLPIISTIGFDRIIHQDVIVSTVSGGNATLTTPLVWDFTNSAEMVEVGTVAISQYQPVRNVILEGFSVTSTNAGSTGSSTYQLAMSNARDCTITNVEFSYGNNYLIAMSACANNKISRCNIHDSLTGGTSHSGLLMIDCSYNLVENSIVKAMSIQIDGGVMGNVFFANFITNNLGYAVICHNTHPMMNLWEQNVIPMSFVQMDGYFGSTSHQTFFRNRIELGFVGKRYTSNMQIVGNVLGTEAFGPLRYSRLQSGSAGLVFDFGMPNIGNSSIDGVTPPLEWNYPGGASKTIYYSANGPADGTRTNGWYAATNDYTSGPILGVFTNVPPSSSIYPIAWQITTNTYTGGRYYPAGGTLTNLAYNGVVSNGWRLWIVGPAAYQQFQSNDIFTCNLHGNLVQTNGGWSLVWDANNADHALPNSYVYSSAPSWWGTNRWPAIDPTNTVSVAAIPAQLRFNGIDSGEGASTPTKLGSVRGRTLRIRR